MDRQSKLKRINQGPLTPVKHDKLTKKCVQSSNKSGANEKDGIIAQAQSQQETKKMEQENSQAIRDIAGELKGISNTLSELKNGQAGLKQSFESRIENLKVDLEKTIASKMLEIKDEFTMEISRLDSLFRDLDTKFTKMGQSLTKESSVRFDPIRTVVAISVPFWKGENIDDKAQEIVNHIKGNPPPGGDHQLQEATIVNVMRLPERPDGKFPIVKIEFETLEQKKAILRGKKTLSTSKSFKRVFIRTSKTRYEMTMERNFQAVLKMIPDGEKLKLAADGQLIPKPPPNVWHQRRGQDVAENGEQNLQNGAATQMDVNQQNNSAAKNNAKNNAKKDDNDD